MTFIAIYGFMSNFEKIKSFLKIKPKQIDENDNVTTPKEENNISILIEPKDTGKLILSEKENKSYLSLSVMFVNTSIDIIVIRNIKAIMNEEIGIFQQQKMMILGSHKGSRANYSLGNTENLLPLSIPGNTSKDAYILFEFQNKEIKAGNVSLEITTSKGEMSISLNTDVIG